MMTELKNNLTRVSNFSTTENGAVGYTTTGSELVDLNFIVPSMRGGVTADNKDKFISALNNDVKYTLKWLLYLRDIRGGLGERDTFISFFNTLANENPELAIKFINIIPEFGRWKDLVDILETSSNGHVSNEIYNVIRKQLAEDCKNLTENKPITLLAKWLPSINASGKARIVAIKICNNLGMSFKDYRKMLSTLRSYLDVTEVKTCSNNWGEIDYNKVSSNANLRYKDAFIKHDSERRNAYLEKLMNPETKKDVVMHVDNLYPHEVYTKYNYIYKVDDSIEAMWQNLKNIKSGGNTMVIVDGSGSMTRKIPNSKVQAIDVSRSLGVYFAERCEGEFKNQLIEFSSSPRFIDIRNCKTLFEKVRVLERYQAISNTDIHKTFSLILDTAIKNNMKQEDLPNRLLIISDMEFDGATTTFDRSFDTLFETIDKEWNNVGYKMPKLVFWNVNSSTNTIPVTTNQYGVILVSGFSVNILEMVMSNETDPWIALKSVLDSDRYNVIDNII